MSAKPRRIRIDLAYDGTHYAGWQLQRREPTIQGTVEAALGRLVGAPRVEVRGAGRTDAGVHARQQVADALLTSRLDDAGVAQALGRILPADIRPLAVATVDERFHSRHHARAKTYRYRLDRTPHGDPFQARWALHVAAPLDMAAIRDTLARLPGQRDWSGFVGSGSDKAHHVRRLTTAEVEVDADDHTVFVFRGDGFLRYMVRNLVGTLLVIGRGRAESTIVERILSSGDRGLAGPTAPAHGLCLERIVYDPED
jgi:tRNA pseudouridine38-40 synthase